jgi:hypothetical protein
MARPLDWISTDPDGKPLSLPRLSTGQFKNQAQERLTHIEEAKQRLESICPPFNGKGTILPITCREAGRALNELRDRVDKLCELLDETSRLPIILTALRYDLLYKLCLVKERIRKLEDLIESYSFMCMSPSSLSSRKQIYDAFQNVFQQISHTSQQVTFQGEAARFQERELISILEDA